MEDPRRVRVLIRGGMDLSVAAQTRDNEEVNSMSHVPELKSTP
jgi:hypothetical protein